jgi:hypothetical protein
MTDQELTPEPKIDAFWMYHQGHQDAERGLEVDERLPGMSAEAQILYWAYRDGWFDWHGRHRG